MAEEGFSLSRLIRSFGSEAGTAERYDRTLGVLRRISIRQVGATRAAWPHPALGGCGRRLRARKDPPPPPLPPACLQGVAYAMYVAGNNFLYNCTRLATLAVGGAAAVAGTVGAEQLTAFMFYTEFLASALLSVCDQWGPIMVSAAGAGAASLGALPATTACPAAASWRRPLPLPPASCSVPGLLRRRRWAPPRGSCPS